MSTDLEFSGKDVSEAVEKACFAHQIDEADLKYEIVRRESKKLFGLLGGKSALIKVCTTEVGGKELVQDLIKTTFGGEFGNADPSKRDSADGRRQKSSKSDQLRNDNPNLEQIVPEFDGPQIQGSLARILELMTVANCDINFSQEGSELHFDIKADDLDLLTSKRGAVLDALQFLVNKMHGQKGGRIFIDCDGFRSRHEEDISGLALRLGEKAKRLRKPVTINSLNAHDRRLVHMALQDDQELRSRSKGDGEFKKVVIYPNNAQRRRSRSKPAAEAV
ncbi:Jag N-terminal domain-containing protein [bacterium]|nr:Jag N-terminal domain-containing protein [bacterium]